MVLKAEPEVSVADAHRQVVAVRSAETVPVNSTVGESQSIGRVENAVQRVAGSDQNAEGCIGEDTDHENQVKRPDIPVDSRVQDKKGRMDAWTKTLHSKIFKTATQGDRLRETLHTQ